MLCKQCNAEIGDAMFCPNCGTNNAPTDIPPVNPPVQPAYQPVQEEPSFSVSVPSEENIPQWDASQTQPQSVGYAQTTSTAQTYGYSNTASVAAQNGYQQYLPQNNPVPPQPTYNAQTMEDPGKSKATAALIWGIVSLFFGWIPGIVAIVFSKKYNEIGNGSNANTAKAGKIMGICGICLSVLAILIVVFVFALFFMMAASV